MRNQRKRVINDDSQPERDQGAVHSKRPLHRTLPTETITDEAICAWLTAYSEVRQPSAVAANGTDRKG